MNRMEALSILRRFVKDNGSRYGILSLGLFGSAARDGLSGKSDVDVVIRLEKPNLLMLSKIRLELEEQFERHVDMVSYRERMNPFLKERINEEACYV